MVVSWKESIEVIGSDVRSRIMAYVDTYVDRGSKSKQISFKCPGWVNFLLFMFIDLNFGPQVNRSTRFLRGT